MKSYVKVLSVTILHSIDNPISKIWEILRDLDLNFFVEPIRCALSFKSGLLIFSNAGHNKRKWHKSSTSLQSHREHLLLCFKLILFNKLFQHNVLFVTILPSIHKGKQPYLKGMRDFEGSKLKLLCWINSLCWNNLLNKMSLKNSNKCSLCDCNVVEDLCHFLLLWI
jgi:hypothetical protein